jgi:putative effector of murein hydrolase
MALECEVATLTRKTKAILRGRHVGGVVSILSFYLLSVELSQSHALVASRLQICLGFAS